MTEIRTMSSMPKRTLPFSVNQYLCPLTMRPTDFLDRIESFGFQGAGITQGALQSLGASEMAAELQRRNLQVTSLNSAGFFLQEGEAALVQAERNLGLLKQSNQLGQSRLNVIVGGSSTLPLNLARELAAERLEAFARQASDFGVQLMVEPLHHLNVRTKSCFNSISQLEPLFERIPGLTLNADLFHLWWDPDLDRLLRGGSLPLGLLQICDVSMNDAEPVPRRVPLGEGCIPWIDHVRAVRMAFPSVSIELELFADQLPGRALEEILAGSASALKTLVEK